MCHQTRSTFPLKLVQDLKCVLEKILYPRISQKIFFENRYWQIFRGHPKRFMFNDCKTCNFHHIINTDIWNKLLWQCTPEIPTHRGSEVQGHLHLHNKFPDTSLGYISPHLKQTNKQTTQLKAEDWEVEATEQEFKVIFNCLEILANLGYSIHYHKQK